MSEPKKRMSDGDRKAWEHAIASGRFNMLTEEECSTLVTLACYTAEKLDGRPEGVPEEELLAVLEWANLARIQSGLLENCLLGMSYIHPRPDGPSFSLSPKGLREAREGAEKMGLPVDDGSQGDTSR